MRVRNLMEDLITEKVDEVFDLKASMDPDFCTCSQCRLDVACYVLNRIRPQYIVSGRGLAHLETNLQQNQQLNIDAVALINEGIKKVSATKRPHFIHANGEPADVPEGPLFNFPAIQGRVFNGDTFEPLEKAEVYLELKGKVVEMMDPNWQNPCKISSKTPGLFSFWPYPIQADAAGEKQTFGFHIIIDLPEYNKIDHYLELSLTADENFVDNFHLEKTQKVSDLFLFPSEKSSSIPGE